MGSSNTVSQPIRSCVSFNEETGQTILYTPPVRPELVSRPHLIERLNAGLHRKLTLISAPAGFGKTTLLSEWVAGCECPVAWVSLDEGDNDPVRFLAYFVAALQTINPNVGEGVLGAFQAPQPPSIESVLTALVNEIVALSAPFVLVLDDYHLIKAHPVHNALTFLLDHLPGNMHLVIACRADPPLPIAHLRGRGQLTELRLTDLRFTLDEVTGFHECFDEIRVIRPFVIFVFQNRDLRSRGGGGRREPVLSTAALSSVEGSKSSAERFSPAFPSTETVLPGGTSSAIMQPC